MEGRKSPNKKTNEVFQLSPNIDAISPGAIGDRSFVANFDEVEEEITSYRSRMSEYNPLSYQGTKFNPYFNLFCTMISLMNSGHH